MHTPYQRWRPLRHPSWMALKSEVPSQAKAPDNQLARLQSFVLDAVAPLTSIVEANAKDERVDHKQAVMLLLQL